MKTIYFFLFLFTCILPFHNGICQQNGSDEDLSRLFDDGGFSTSKNVLKLNLTSVYVGDVSVFYERVFTENLALEAGVGFQLPYYNPEFFGLYEEVYGEYPNPTGGYSLWLNPRYYLTDAPLENYVGLLYRQRNYNQFGGGEIRFSDYALNGGIQWDIFERVVLDYNMGIGFRLINSSQLLETEIALIMPLIIKIGYLF